MPKSLIFNAKDFEGMGNPKLTRDVEECYKLPQEGRNKTPAELNFVQSECQRSHLVAHTTVNLQTIKPICKHIYTVGVHEPLSS